MWVSGVGLLLFFSRGAQLSGLVVVEVLMTEAQSMLKSVDIHGGISDLRVLSYSLYQ
jgi:hypothetical protein